MNRYKSITNLHPYTLTIKQIKITRCLQQLFFIYIRPFVTNICGWRNYPHFSAALVRKKLCEIPGWAPTYLAKFID